MHVVVNRLKDNVNDFQVSLDLHRDSIEIDIYPIHTIVVESPKTDVVNVLKTLKGDSSP